MPLVKGRDGTEIFYKDWGEGPPVVFSHGWPLSGDDWEETMLLLASRGFRTIAHDRRGHGRSAQPWLGHDMDTYADDLASLIESLGLRSVVLVGHSTGGGEVTRYIGRHGTARLSRLVLLAAVPPLLQKTPTSPDGIPREALDALRAGLLADRAQFLRDFTEPFYGANRPGSRISQGVRDAFWTQAMRVGLKAVYDCVAAFSETDFTEDLARIDIPTLILHGDDDQVVPLRASSLRTAKLVKGSILKVYPGAPHALARTHAAQFGADLLTFLRGGPR